MLAFCEKSLYRDFHNDVVIIYFTTCEFLQLITMPFFTTFSYGLRCYNTVVITPLIFTTLFSERNLL